MNPSSANLMKDLVERKNQIEDSIPWEELENEKRVERLRDYVKREFRILEEHLETMLNILTKRVTDLEEHKHNEDGEVIVERKLHKKDGILQGDYMTKAISGFGGTVAVNNKGESYI